MSSNQKSPVMVWGRRSQQPENSVSFSDVMSEELAKNLQSK
jgi:hypothetical protein